MYLSPNFRPKIYIRRGNANYRKIINEADLIERLRKKDFEITILNILRFLNK